jgi:hypothetical protein
MTGNNPVMSELRFSRLSAVKTPDELLRQLLRAVRLLNGVVNLSWRTTSSTGVGKTTSCLTISAASSGRLNLSVSAGRWNITRPVKPTTTINKGLSNDHIYSAAFTDCLSGRQPEPRRHRFPENGVLGGATRLRVSSQSLKRAWRTSELFEQALAGNIGIRSGRIAREAAKILIEKGIDEKKPSSGAKIADYFGKAKADKKAKDLLTNTETEQLVHISPAEFEAVKALAQRLAEEKRAPKKKNSIYCATIVWPSISRCLAACWPISRNSTLKLPARCARFRRQRNDC